MGAGIVRKIDDLGRIVIPREMCRTLNIGPGVEMDICMQKNGIFLKQYKPGCIVCGGQENLVEANGSRICSCCLTEFNKIK